MIAFSNERFILYLDRKDGFNIWYSWGLLTLVKSVEDVSSSEHDITCKPVYK